MILNVFDPDEPWVFNWFGSICRDHQFNLVIKLSLKDSLRFKVDERLTELSKITNYNFIFNEYGDIMVDIPDEEITYIKLKYS